MRIAFCGASGTGKSRLADHVAEKYGLSMCPVGSRQVAQAMGFDSPYDVDRAGMRAAFQRRLFVEKRAWEADHEDFVSDRTTFDNLAYATMHGARMTREEIGEYVAAMSRYTLVVHLPVSVFHRVGDDPVRVQERGYHDMFDLILRGLLAKYGTSTAYTLLAGLHERQSVLDAYIQGRSSEGLMFRGGCFW